MVDEGNIKQVADNMLCNTVVCINYVYRQMSKVLNLELKIRKVISRELVR